MRRASIFVIALGILLIGATAALAGNSWGGFHWQDTTADPHDGDISLTLVNAFDATGLQTYAKVYDDWKLSVYGAVLFNWDKEDNGGKGPLSLRSQLGESTSLACLSIDPTLVSGKIYVCNSQYGKNGWIGLAWISVDPDGHIDAGAVLMNDSYLLQPNSLYNNPLVCRRVPQCPMSDPRISAVICASIGVT